MKVTLVKGHSLTDRGVITVTKYNPTVYSVHNPVTSFPHASGGNPEKTWMPAFAGMTDEYWTLFYVEFY